jgi:hypothetical protein
MPSQTELSDPNKDRRNALVIFYAAAAMCGAAGASAAASPPHGRDSVHVAMIALAALSALAALWSLVHILRAADELQRRINHLALAFAYVGTLVVCLVCSFLQQAGLRCVSWLGVCGLLVALWSMGLILFSRRYQ